MTEIVGLLQCPLASRLALVLAYQAGMSSVNWGEAPAGTEVAIAWMPR